MKKIENSFSVTGYVGNDAEIRQLTGSSVARFSLAVSRQDKTGDNPSWISAFASVEVWRKNDNTDSFGIIKKGTLLTVEGYFRPDEWTDKDGVRHSRLLMVANRFYEAVEKEEKEQSSEKPEPEPEKKTKGGRKSSKKDK